jgi:hypothetical protein
MPETGGRESTDTVAAETNSVGDVERAATTQHPARNPEIRAVKAIPGRATSNNLSVQTLQIETKEKKDGKAQC